MQNLRVAMIAPPWISMPPVGYGGLEYVVHFLMVELRRMGVEVELFATADTTTPASRLHACYDEGQYAHIHKPLYDVVALPITHQLFALEQIRADGGFDIIHDHNGFLGPALAAYLDPALFPPVLHTLHGPFTGDALVARGVADNRHVYTRFAQCDRLYFNGISRAQLTEAPTELLGRTVDVVYNAVNIDDYPFRMQKEDYVITLARFARDKGQATAARIARQCGVRLLMAGIVNGIGDAAELEAELADPQSRHRDNLDFAYYRDEVLPHVAAGKVEFVGNKAGAAKMDFVSRAKALLFPIDWEEPFGLAVIEALACGTPVVAMRRGAMPEIVEHGVNGFLADSVEEFAGYVERVGEIDPAECRRTVESRFSAAVMAEAYLACYRTILRRHAGEALRQAIRPGEERRVFTRGRSLPDTVRAAASSRTSPGRWMQAAAGRSAADEDVETGQ